MAPVLLITLSPWRLAQDHSQQGFIELDTFCWGMESWSSRRSCFRSIGGWKRGQVAGQRVWCCLLGFLDFSAGAACSIVRFVTFSSPKLLFRELLGSKLTCMQGPGSEWKWEGLPSWKKKHRKLIVLLHSCACVLDREQRSSLLLSHMLSYVSGNTRSSWFIFPFCAFDRGMDTKKCSSGGGEIGLKVGAGLSSGDAGSSLGMPPCPLFAICPLSSAQESGPGVSTSPSSLWKTRNLGF